MPARRPADPAAVARARRLLQAYARLLRPHERRVLERLLERAEQGTLGRREALAQLEALARARGLSSQEGLRRLRGTPWGALLDRLVPPE